MGGVIICYNDPYTLVENNVYPLEMNPPKFQILCKRNGLPSNTEAPTNSMGCLTKNTTSIKIQESISSPFLDLFCCLTVVPCFTTQKNRPHWGPCPALPVDIERLEGGIHASGRPQLQKFIGLKPQATKMTINLYLKYFNLK